MSVQMSEEEIYREARKRVEAKKGFFIHLTVYIIVNIMLVLIWAFPGGGGFPWFVFPLGGWGIGILFHFLEAFVFSRQTDWERKAIEKEVERLRKGGR
jgi:fatty acid desaturase